MREPSEPRTRLLSERAWTSLLTVLVVVASIAFLVLVPHHLLRPISMGFVAFAVLVVFGVRFYLRRLEGVARALASTHTDDPASLLTGLLTESERALLVLRARGTADEMILRLRRRQSALYAVAMCVAVPGICAFMLVVYLYSD